MRPPPGLKPDLTSLGEIAARHIPRKTVPPALFILLFNLPPPPQKNKKSCENLVSPRGSASVGIRAASVLNPRHFNTHEKILSKPEKTRIEKGLKYEL